MNILQSNKYLAALFAGIASLFNIFPPAPPTDGGFEEDARNIAGDWERIGQDLYSAIEAYENGKA